MGRYHYAGIGSRETPPDVLHYMKGLARNWGLDGMILRSGHARGADTAFEEGCDLAEGKKEIFLADDATPDSMKHAAEFHPNWNRLSPYAKKLHARNSLIVLGRGLNDPVGIIVCWTPKGCKIGGTAQALRIAEHYNITVANLGDAIYDFTER